MEQFICLLNINYHAESETTTMSMATQSYNLIIVVIVVISVVVLFTFNFVIVCVCFYLKYKQLSKPSDIKGTSGDVQLSQSTQPTYETVMGSATVAVELKMTENVAYATIH